MLNSYTSVRRVSFFLPSFRLNEFNRRQIQNNPTIELLEENYNELQTNIKANSNKPPLTEKAVPNSKPLARYSFESSLIPENETLLSYSLNQSDTSLFKYEDNILLSQSKIDDKTEKLIASIKYSLHHPNTKYLYDALKLNNTRIKHLKGRLSNNDISILIKRIVSFNNANNQRLRFITKNKSVLTKSAEYYNQYIKKGNEMTRKMYLSTRGIFNVLVNEFDLSIYDYENIIGYYYQMNKFQKCIDTIAEFETKANKNINELHLTNKIWWIKLEILSNTNIIFWRLFGNPIYRVSSSKSLTSSYAYPHHTQNFQILMQRYENDKLKYKLSDDIKILSVLIRGLGKHCDIQALNKLIESYWGIKIDLESPGEKAQFLKQFNINKNVPKLLWPEESILRSIVLAYAKNGYISLAVEINNLIIEKYYANDSKSLVKYWETTLLSAGLFGEAVETELMISMKNVIDHDIEEKKLDEDVLNLRYRLFDEIYKMAEKSLGGDKIPRNIINLKIKYSSSHELMNHLPNVYKRMRNVDYNKTHANAKVNNATFNIYVRECCKELARRGKFLDANTLINNFVKSKKQRETLKTMLVELQEVYARERVKAEEKKRRVVDDDNDFELW